MEDNFNINQNYPEFPETDDDSHIMSVINIPSIDSSDSLISERVERSRKASMAEDIEHNNRNEERLERIRMVIKTDEFRYIGETLNNLRDGFGICYYTNGEVHIGEWKNNLKEGYGKSIFPDNSISQGEMKNNKFEGFCEKITKNSIVYGFVSNGSFIDEIVIKKNNQTIEKNVECNILKKIIDDNRYFMGEANLGISVSVPVTYAGYLINNMPNGYGEIYKDGIKFFGNFIDNKRNGLSLEFTKDDKVNIGYYINDVKNGAFFVVTKAGFKMEMYHLGFKIKTVEKFDNCKKYLLLNYPEFASMLKVNYKLLIDKFSQIDLVNI